MASEFVSSVNVLLLIVIVSSFLALPALSLEFDVGGSDGWAVPPEKDPHMYNDWASKNRFNVGDIVRFKYNSKTDSVMVVTEEEYGNCNSSQPEFFSSNGNTEYKLTRSGAFYFISGVPGNCEKGEKMIIRVISHAPGSSPPGPDSPSSAVVVAVSARSIAAAAATLVVALFFHV